MSQIRPQGYSNNATATQLKRINDLTPKDVSESETPAKQPKEVAEVVHKERTPLTIKQRGKLRRELEIAIARAEKAVADAEEDSQEDEWGAAERRYLGTELKQLSDERRARTEAVGRRNKKTIREIHNAEAKAARVQLEDLKARLAEIEAEQD